MYIKLYNIPGVLHKATKKQVLHAKRQFNFLELRRSGFNFSNMGLGAEDLER